MNIILFVFTPYATFILAIAPNGGTNLDLSKKNLRTRIDLKNGSMSPILVNVFLMCGYISKLCFVMRSLMIV